MSYRGQIGEFKPQGFLLALLVCLTVAFSIYFRVKKLETEPRKDDVKATADAAASRVKELDAEVKQLRSEVLSLQSQLKADRSKKK